MFSLGFEKIAQFDHNNQGLEYGMSDTNNSTADVGPGGMTPAGLESYQPIMKQPQASPSGKIKNRRMTPQETSVFLTAKGVL